jgi:2',3'-cyclic-nucleotide 2'-phosphodiesterase (5'-nucleotidase family)
MVINMKNRIVAAIFMLCTTLFLFGSFLPADASGEIVVLYTNDVHCSVDDNIGYAGLAAYKIEMEKLYGKDKVTLVDAGDAVQGSAIGYLSKGEYIIDIMNKVGYDVITLGNHEFDYGMDHLHELMKKLDANPISCNFKSLQTGDTVFKPYKIIDYGDTQIGFVGITTPKSITSSTPKYFQDSQGNYIYGFCENSTGKELYSAVQNAVNASLAEGADCVVAVGHCGIGDTYDPWESTDIIANTTGIDVFIDGHSHSTIKGKIYPNKDGKDVVLTSTGTRLASIGKLTRSSNGTITTDLITGYIDKDENIKGHINNIKVKNEKLLNTVVAKTDVTLLINNPMTGKRLIRKCETNLGDLVADAYRDLLGADIAVVNGGGIRADIAAGDITYNDIISVHPFGNLACLIAATGQEILDLLEMGARNTPGESGGFQQVSGLTYDIHTYIKPSVILDDKGNFVKVGGEYRVHNVMIGRKPLDLNKTYTVASHSYLIKNGGDGFGLFMDNKLLKDEVMIDYQVLISYITDKLGGVVGHEYKHMNGQGRIHIFQFKDIDNHWAKEAINDLSSSMILSGLGDGNFAPDRDLTRAEFAAIIVKALELKPENGVNPFNDVKATDWYYQYIATASKHNIISGYGNGKFGPQDQITSEQAMSIIARAMQVSGLKAEISQSEIPSLLNSFSINGTPSAWAQNSIALCVKTGIADKNNGNITAVKGILTRAEAAVMIRNYLEVTWGWQTLTAT